MSIIYQWLSWCFCPFVATWKVAVTSSVLRALQTTRGIGHLANQGPLRIYVEWWLKHVVATAFCRPNCLEVFSENQQCILNHFDAWHVQVIHLLHWLPVSSDPGWKFNEIHCLVLPVVRWFLWGFSGPTVVVPEAVGLDAFQDTEYNRIREKTTQRLLRLFSRTWLSFWVCFTIMFQGISRGIRYVGTFLDEKHCTLSNLVGGTWSGWMAGQQPDREQASTV